jgi:hypothetical protein
MGKSSAVPNTYATNFLDTLNREAEESAEEDSDVDVLQSTEGTGSVNEDEQKVLDRVAEALARLGRVKRVGLGVSEKVEFAKMWTKRRR